MSCSASEGLNIRQENMYARSFGIQTDALYNTTHFHTYTCIINQSGSFRVCWHPQQRLRSNANEKADLAWFTSFFSILFLETFENQSKADPNLCQTHISEDTFSSDTVLFVLLLKQY